MLLKPPKRAQRAQAARGLSITQQVTRFRQEVRKVAGSNPLWRRQNGVTMTQPHRRSLLVKSTRLTLRLPESLALEAASVASEQGISLNAFLILGTRNWITYQKRIMGGTLSRPAPPTVEAPVRPPVSGKVGRNDPCPCGSGRKWKVCHGKP